VPDTIDLAAAIVGIGDASQVVYFNRMFISQVSGAPTSQAPTNHPVMRENYAPRDPMEEDPHERTLDQQIRGQMGEKYPNKKYAPREGFHFETRQLRLGAQKQPQLGKSVGFDPNVDFDAARIRANPPAYVGTYKSDTVDQSSVGGRHDQMVSFGMHRELRLNAVPPSDPGFVEMWINYTDKRKLTAVATSGTEPTAGLTTMFAETAGGKAYEYVSSQFKYTPVVNADGILIERASGGNASASPGTWDWSAMISWKKVGKAG
jgi:hypothetical protein